MENKIVIAVIGCGRIAQNAHFPAFSQMDNIRVKYACDLIEEKANAMKEKYAFVENVITDYKIALADNEVDCVYVLTPNYAHYTVTMDALRAGKHVFCEKPITVNYALSKEMEEESEISGPYDQLVNNERMSIIHRLINELPEKQRLIMQLRDIEGESYKEIAKILNLTEEQVKVNLFRARQKVKQRYLEIDEYGL